MRFVSHTEGRTRLLVPEASLTKDPPPTFPVFFNPAASLNRDVTVAITASTGGATFCDAMAGVGARGLRVAKEVGNVKVTMVDFNSKALDAGRKAAVLNGVRRKCEFSTSETTSYLFSRFGKDQRYDFVDVDPFGTPVRQIQAALSATSDGGIMSVTATDTAVLCGVHTDTCKRRYGSSPLNNHFHHETGARILIGAIARLGASLDIGIEPVAAHSTRHYIRVYSRVRPGASKADAALKELGYVDWCPACGEVRSSPAPEPTCAVCGKKAKVAGQLWKGGVADVEVLRRAGTRAATMGLGAASRVLESLIGVDAFTPWSFSIGGMCSKLKIPSVPEAYVYRNLVEGGHEVMRTPFEKTGIKTKAGYGEVLAAVRAAARGGARLGGSSGPN
ncbi:MAG: hypothetical protein KGI38_07850 [Thaumarchaeota archaeon]|nr:hypothetical protein [Nitrososphaerota archaeon]